MGYDTSAWTMNFEQSHSTQHRITIMTGPTISSLPSLATPAPSHHKRKRPRTDAAAVSSSDGSTGSSGSADKKHCASAPRADAAAHPLPSPAYSSSSSAGSGGSDGFTTPSSSTSTSSGSSGATAAETHHAVVPRRTETKTTVSPSDFFAALLRERGYPADIMVSSLKCGYHNSPTPHQMASYGLALTRAVRSADAPTTRSLLAAGLHPNACNRFGESVVHAACRRGDAATLRALLDGGAHVGVTDDFGRTPLHDACWTSRPRFEAVVLLLEADPWLPCARDCRGASPLGYVRPAHWGAWIGFLEAVADRYWPAAGRERRHDPATVVPLARLDPHSRPLPDPKGPGRDLGVIELIANGKLLLSELEAGEETTSPTDLTCQTFPARESSGVTLAPCSVITLDPLTHLGAKAAAHASQEKSAAALMQGFVQVSATTQ